MATTKGITLLRSIKFKVGQRGHRKITGMRRGWQFLGKVDFDQVPQLSDSLLPAVEGNLIGHIGSEAGRE